MPNHGRMVSAGESVKYQVAGNDATVEFETGLAVLTSAEIQVWLDDAQQTLGADYTVAITGGFAVVTMGTAPATGETLTVLRTTAIAQALDLTYNDRLPSTAIEARFDQIIRAVRDLDARQVIRFPAAEAAASNQTLSSAADRKGKLLYFNATTGAMEEISIADLQTLLGI